MLMLEKVRRAEDDIGSRIHNMLMDNNRSQSAVGLRLSNKISQSLLTSECITRQKKSAAFFQAMEEDR